MVSKSHSQLTRHTASHFRGNGQTWR